MAARSCVPRPFAVDVARAANDLLSHSTHASLQSIAGAPPPVSTRFFPARRAASRPRVPDARAALSTPHRRHTPVSSSTAAPRAPGTTTSSPADARPITSRRGKRPRKNHHSEDGRASKAAAATCSTWRPGTTRI
eukprot:29835-Pelagococcus_subviridis.AAC.5